MPPRTDYYAGSKPRRSVRPGAKQRWRVEIEDEIDEAEQAQREVDLPDYCGDWCPCGANLPNWMDWLRSLAVYPIPRLAVPLLPVLN